MTVTAIVGSLAEWAVHYAAGGWEIFPGNPRTKAPLVTHGALDATSDTGQIADWWQRWPDALICHRLPEGLVLVDVDVRHGGDQTWLTIKTEYGPLPPTRTHHSGRGDGGGHVWYRWPGGRPSTQRLDQWAQQRQVGHETPTGSWSAGIDLLHHGHRYTILPPSLHPDTGAPYQWKGGPDDELADIPAGLAELLTASSTPNETQVNGHKSTTSDSDSIAEWYTANHTVEQLLDSHGWRQVGRDRWKHPQASNAHSATVKHGCLFVYTPTPGLPVTEPGDPHGLTPFRLHALLDHHGDLSAAAAAARRQKDGDQARVRPDISWATQQQTNGNGTANEAQPAATAVEPPWPEPAPLVDIDTPSFPLEALPAWIGDHCEAVADRLQVPTDLCAQLALGVLSTIAMGHLRIHITGSWAEPANLYLTTVMASGSGKSPADKFMVAPLRRLETELIEQSKADRDKAQHDRAIAEKRAAKLRDRAASANDDDTERAIRDAWAAQQRADEIDERPEPRLLASDVTPEMLAVLLDRHQGRIAIVSTEADLYDVVLGSYSRRPNISVLLKAWSGDEVIVDRKGGSGTAATAIRIPEAFLTVSLTVQPVALASLRKHPELETKGFVPRFMHAWPQDLVGSRDHSRVLDQRPITTTAAYDEHVMRLGRTLASWITPADLHYTPDAGRALIDWQQQLEGRLGPGGELAHLKAWVSKIVGSTARLAGLLHLAGDQATITDPVDASTVGEAITVGRYWLTHAAVVVAHCGPDTWGAERVLTWLQTRKPDTFTRRDVFVGNRRQFPDADSTQEALDRLADLGWIREAGERTQGAKGRNPIYQPHPRALEGHGS